MAHLEGLRRRVVSGVQGREMTIAETADTFQIGTATAERYLRRYRETGNLTPRTFPGRRLTRVECTPILVRPRLRLRAPDLRLGSGQHDPRPLRTPLQALRQISWLIGLAGHPAKRENTFSPEHLIYAGALRFYGGLKKAVSPHLRECLEPLQYSYNGTSSKQQAAIVAQNFPPGLKPRASFLELL